MTYKRNKYPQQYYTFERFQSFNRGKEFKGADKFAPILAFSCFHRADPLSQRVIHNNHYWQIWSKMLTSSLENHMIVNNLHNQLHMQWEWNTCKGSDSSQDTLCSLWIHWLYCRNHPHTVRIKHIMSHLVIKDTMTWLLCNINRFASLSTSKYRLENE